MFAIERNSGKLNGMISATLRVEKLRRDLLHSTYMSCLVHVATHRNPVCLNRLFNGLNEGDRRLITQHIRKQQTVVDNDGKAVLDADGNVQLNDMAFLTFEKKAWAVIPGTTENGHRFITHVETNLLNPADGKMFLDSDPVKAQALFGAADFRKA